MPQCARCEQELEANSGLLTRLGIGSLDGYECSKCGTLLCSNCFNERTLELAGSTHDRCPACDGTLRKR
ncbi:MULTISPECIES: hypothetical protein [Halopenitus]|uniref:RING-type domain-containing protein n=1 Tax=Halopenitus malekzadehii TaxID=1267564 RepID=A0A1H6HVV1_9EURY|nr:MULTISPECIES: hypothetical protein [Halopenitus]SEH38261.1 hypothetical protein SAMN05192561_101341 [Halopenitus malekzadehii]